MSFCPKQLRKDSILVLNLKQYTCILFKKNEAKDDIGLHEGPLLEAQVLKN